MTTMSNSYRKVQCNWAQWKEGASDYIDKQVQVSTLIGKCMRVQRYIIASEYNDIQVQVSTMVSKYKWLQEWPQAAAAAVGQVWQVTQVSVAVIHQVYKAGLTRNEQMLTRAPIPSVFRSKEKDGIEIVKDGRGMI